MTTPGSQGPEQPPGGGGSGWGQPPAGSPGGYSPPPPPPGGAPPPPSGFGQGQYPPQGQPYPQQGQYQPQQGQPYPPQGQPYPPQGGFGAPQRSGRPKWLIPVIAAFVVVVALGGLYWFLTTPEFGVDDCLRRAGDDEVEQVDCDDSNAEARVIGIHDEELTESEYYSDSSTCSEFPETVGQVWVANTIGDEGTVYCVVPIG